MVASVARDRAERMLATYLCNEGWPLRTLPVVPEFDHIAGDTNSGNEPKAPARWQSEENRTGYS